MSISGKNIFRKHRPRYAPVLTVLSLLLLATGIFFGVKFLIAQKAARELSNSPDLSQATPQDLANISLAPTRIDIKSLNISAPVVPLTLAADNTMQVPAKDNEIGWYVLGAKPGNAGSAVMIGHLDSTTGPAVFWNLKKIKPGDDIEILRSDGSKAIFRVDSLQNYSQDNFPTQLVYANTNYASLRLITCAGTYNRKLGRYSENLVVFATLK